MKNTTIIQLIHALLILLFGYTGLTKLLSIHGFISALARSPLLHDVASIIAWLIPIAELVIVALLLVPKTQTIGLTASFVMLLVFTGYILYMLVFIPHLPCSCGGIISALSWQEHLVLNIVMSLLAWVGLWLKRCSKQPITNQSYR